MPSEPPELSEARALLGRFEAEMHRPEGLVHLSDALLLLADVRAGAVSDQIALVATNLSLAYLKRVQVAVESLLSRESSLHWEIINHWRTVFGEFELSGFGLPQDIAETRSKLLNKKVELMPLSERQELIERLQATGKKRDI